MASFHFFWYFLTANGPRGSTCAKNYFQVWKCNSYEKWVHFWKFSEFLEKSSVSPRTLVWFAKFWKFAVLQTATSFWHGTRLPAPQKKVRPCVKRSGSVIKVVVCTVTMIYASYLVAFMFRLSRCDVLCALFMIYIKLLWVSCSLWTVYRFLFFFCFFFFFFW